MNKWLDIIVASLTVISLVIVLIDYILTLSTSQKLVVYLFDLAVVICLAWDFSSRIKGSSHKTSYVLKHWYEFPARSEERRVGKECRSVVLTYDEIVEMILIRSIVDIVCSYE